MSSLTGADGLREETVGRPVSAETIIDIALVARDVAASWASLALGSRPRVERLVGVAVLRWW